MTNLPTYTEAIEAEALAFAREMIAGFARGDNPWSADPAMSANASTALFHHIVQLALQFTQTRMDIIAAAKAGDADAIEVLRALLLESKAIRADMPSDLIEYDMHITRHGERRSSRPGPKKKSYLLRDLCITQTVAAVIDRYRLDPTGRSPRRKSACAIVVEALRLEAGLNMDYDAVRKIWERYGHTMPTVAGWASS
jgi:hypothetical protein